MIFCSIGALLQWSYWSNAMQFKAMVRSLVSILETGCAVLGSADDFSGARSLLDAVSGSWECISD